MTDTAKIRQQRALNLLEKKVEENTQRNIQNPVGVACKELANIIGYSESYLKKLYYNY